MKKRLLVLILIIGVILTGCSRSSEKITAREQRKVDRYLEGYNNSGEKDNLFMAKFDKEKKSFIIVMEEDAIITIKENIKNSIDDTSKFFREKIGDDFTIKLVNNAEDFTIYEVKNQRVILNKFDEYTGRYYKYTSYTENGFAEQEKKILNDFVEEFNNTSDNGVSVVLDEENRTLIVKLDSTYLISSAVKLKHSMDDISDTFIKDINRNIAVRLCYEDDVEKTLYEVKDRKVLSDNFDEYLKEHPERDKR